MWFFNLQIHDSHWPFLFTCCHLFLLLHLSRCLPLYNLLIISQYTVNQEHVARALVFSEKPWVCHVVGGGYFYSVNPAYPFFYLVTSLLLSLCQGAVQPVSLFWTGGVIGYTHATLVTLVSWWSGVERWSTGRMNSSTTSTRRFSCRSPRQEPRE